MLTASRTLSEFVSDALYDSMPADLFDLARLYVLDVIGSMIIGATKPWSQMQRKVEMRADQEFDRLFRKRSPHVTVTLKIGITYSATNRGAVGSIHNPLSKTQIEEKFMTLADPILPRGRAKDILQRVERIDDAPGISGITALLRFDAGVVSAQASKPHVVARGR